MLHTLSFKLFHKTQSFNCHSRRLKAPIEKSGSNKSIFSPKKGFSDKFLTRFGNKKKRERGR